MTISATFEIGFLAQRDSANWVNSAPVKPLMPLLFLCGCASFSPVTIARQMGTIGWFQADANLKWKHVDRGRGCNGLDQQGPTDEILVIVPGFKGDGPEISAVVPVLASAKPGSIFLFRYVPWQSRDEISREFAIGASHLLRCLPSPHGPVVVLAHSAGGMVVSHAAHLLSMPRTDQPGPALYLMTVASPLAGMTGREPNADGSEEVRFMLDFGTRIQGYPVAPTSVAAVHLRTQYPGDQVMKPTKGVSPNDPHIGIPGARQVDLPADLTHDSALAYVAAKIADGSWRAWFTPEP